MNKVASIIVVAALVIAIGILFLGRAQEGLSAENIEVRDGVQYITINARGGYSPKESAAQAGLPTKLIVKTNDTYDCSLALVIKAINYKKILPSSGEEIIDLGTPQAGTLRGLCSMGMYNFTINFN